MDSASGQGPLRRAFDFEAIGRALEGAKAGLSPDAASVQRRMLEGYHYVDALLAAGRDPFVYGGSALLLEMNHIVLCGLSPARRIEFGPHIEATERRFYEDHLCGADSFYAWADENAHLRPLSFAARAFRRIVGAPQVFIEGNRRTATLLASYVLGRAGSPPLVRREDDPWTFDALSAACQAIDRRQLTSVPFGLILDWRLERFIARSADVNFLVRAAGKPEADQRPLTDAREDGSAPG